MTLAKLTILAQVASLLGASPALAQTAKGDEPAGQLSMPAISSEPSPAWVVSLSGYAYFVPDSPNYVMPIVMVDHEALHLEARYNYEDLSTGSVWAGYNLSGGSELAWELIPMVGGVFGNTNGVAPGLKGSLGWWKLELYSEGEYLFDLTDSSGNFFYNWSELTIAPWEWLRLGLVTQRTRVYAAKREIQRGLLAGLTYQEVASVTFYVLNPDDSEPILIFAAGLTFE